MDMVLIHRPKRVDGTRRAARQVASEFQTLKHKESPADSGLDLEKIEDSHDSVAHSAPNAEKKRYRLHKAYQKSVPVELRNAGSSVDSCFRSRGTRRRARRSWVSKNL